MLISILVVCQTNPKSKSTNSIKISKINGKPPATKAPSMKIAVAKNVQHPYKKSVTILRLSKPSDHSFDPLDPK